MEDNLPDLWNIICTCRLYVYRYILEIHIRARRTNKKMFSEVQIGENQVRIRVQD